MTSIEKILTSTNPDCDSKCNNPSMYNTKGIGAKNRTRKLLHTSLEVPFTPELAKNGDLKPLRRNNYGTATTSTNLDSSKKCAIILCMIKKH